MEYLIIRGVMFIVFLNVAGDMFFPPSTIIPGGIELMNVAHSSLKLHK